jgi:hypothetical protein
VEVAVADVTKNTGKQAEIVHLLLAHLDDISQPTERDCDIGAPWRDGQPCVKVGGFRA